MFIYYIKKVIRAKSFLFWNLTFPLILMTCMHFAFGNIYNIENNISPMNAVLVSVGEGNYQESFETVMTELSSDDADRKLFELSYADSIDSGRAMLEQDAEVLFVVTDDDISVTLAKKHSSTAGAVARGVTNSFRQRYALMADAFESDPASASSVLQMITEEAEQSFAKPADNVFSEDPNPYTWYFYSTFVMAIFFDSMSGVNMVGDLKADVTREAMRFSVSPSKKSRMIILAFIARLIPCLAIAGIQLAVMKLVFGLSLGTDPVKLIVFVVSAVIFSIGFGVMCGLLFKGNVESRANKAMAIVMTSVFLSGEMIMQIPGLFEKYCPIINDINPATVINMAFYKMAVCGNDAGFYLNIIKIIGLAVLFLVIGVIILRREKYASL